MADAELDSLLDDALQDFGATPAAAGGAAAPRDDGSGATSAAGAAPLPFDPMGGAPKRGKKGKAASARAAPDDAATEEAARELTGDLSRLIAAMSQGGPALGGRLGGDAGEEDILSTIAALEAQTRFTTGGTAAVRGAGDAGAGPSDALPPGMDEASYQAMLQQFEQLGSDPAMASMLETMMSQLLSKEVLYEPLQQMCSRYPSWLANQRGCLPEEEYARYTRQSALVAQLLAVFDNSPDDGGRVMSLMQEMQACGAPPQDIMSELAPGLSFNGDGTPQFGGDAGVPPAEELAKCAQM